MLAGLGQPRGGDCMWGPTSPRTDGPPQTAPGGCLPHSSVSTQDPKLCPQDPAPPVSTRQDCHLPAENPSSGARCFSPQRGRAPGDKRCPRRPHATAAGESGSRAGIPAAPLPSRVTLGKTLSCSELWLVTWPSDFSSPL